MTDKKYDLLARIARIVLPIAVFFYVMFAEKLGLPTIDDTTKTALATLSGSDAVLNVVLEYISKVYFIGKEIVTKDGYKL